MESSTSKRLEDERKQAELRKQIAALQAQLVEIPSHKDPADKHTAPSTPKKRKRTEPTVLVPSTPSPKKQRKPTEQAEGRVLSSRVPELKVAKAVSGTAHGKQFARSSQLVKPAPSAVLSKLASYSTTLDPSLAKTTVYRSSGFSEKPPKKDDISATVSNDRDLLSRNRNDDMTVIEDIQLGPKDHKVLVDDPSLQTLEPNSGIRLSSRAMPHEDFQDYLRGRYYLSPSRLYSVIRLLPNKQGYDVPVEGDWVTIAVVAERGPIRESKAPVGIGKDGTDDVLEKEDTIDDISLQASTSSAKPGFGHWNGKGKKKEEPMTRGRKYMNLKLIDFGCRTKSSTTGGKLALRGDAFLSLLLFESDRVENVEYTEGKKEKKYIGGSRGAFEKSSKLREGAVVALLNPKILKPFQRSGDAPHPTDNILALTPESYDSMAVIGYAKDLGMCTVTKRDGKPCGSWVDKRVSEVCEWHIQRAVESKRAARAEFSIGTSGMSSSAKRKPAYDPARQWGLKPENKDPDGATYVVSGHIVSGGSDPRNMFVSETIGREAQARAARVSAQDADKALEKLLKRDKEGMQRVVAARKFGKKMDKKHNENEHKVKKGSKGKEEATDEDAADSADSQKDSRPKKNAYSAGLIRNIGFDPTAKDRGSSKDDDAQKKLQSLASLQASRKNIELGPRPGKSKSNVRLPPTRESVALLEDQQRKSTSLSEDGRLELSDSDDDLYILGRAEEGPSDSAPEGAVDSSLVSLDSDDDLVILPPEVS